MADQGTSMTTFKKLLVSKQNQVLVLTFDGSQLVVTGRYIQEDWLPSWCIVFKRPNFLYTVNLLADDISLLHLRPDHSAESNLRREKWAMHKPVEDADLFLSKLYIDKAVLVNSARGSKGGVYLEFNANQTRMVQACFFSDMIDIWDVSAADGNPKLMKSLSIPGKPGLGHKQHHPHQAVLDPTKRFFVVPNLGSDTLLVLDSKDDAFEIVNMQAIPPLVGNHVGPRHVAFLTNLETHYLVLVSEFTSELFLFEALYVENGIQFKELQRQPTYSGEPSKVNSHPAQVQVSRNQRDVYISNLDTDDGTDNIAHYAFQTLSGAPRLHYVGKVSSGGSQPRSFCLSRDTDQKYIFISNETGRLGIQVLQRDPTTGTIDPTPVATMLNEDLIVPESQGQGPHFICEI